MVNIGVNLPGVDVGLSLGTPTPAPSTPTPAKAAPVALTQKQMLIPTKDLNGAVVKWVMQTIEYDEALVNPPNTPKNFAKLAPWTIQYRVVSTP